MSIKTTQKQIKETNAKDITYMRFEDLQKLKDSELYFKQLAYSAGVYGVNGMLLQGYNTKELYKITSRTSAIYIY